MFLIIKTVSKNIFLLVLFSNKFRSALRTVPLQSTLQRYHPEHMSNNFKRTDFAVTKRIKENVTRLQTEKK